MSVQSLNILCVGATGSIGRHVVEEALACGHTVSALARSPRAASRFPAKAELEIGDLTRAETLVAALKGIDAVVFTHGVQYGAGGAESVDYGGVRNVLAALEGRTVRMALMTSISVTDAARPLVWKRRAERLLRASGNPYTIVRPGWFDYNDDDQLRIVMRQGDSRHSVSPSDGVIARRQIARVLVDSLVSDTAIGKTLELAADHGSEQEDFAPLCHAEGRRAGGARRGA